MPTSTPTTRTYAYYCSGHGYGHATRVTALALHLLSQGHRVKIVTNAPPHIFDSVLAHESKNGSYRNAAVDAGVVQPKAYDIDRAATLEGLRGFMASRERMITEEAEWMKQEEVDCVLVDATFVPCAAAQRAGIPSVVVSNFTFCSCYSYLSAPLVNSLYLSDDSEDSFLDGAGPEASEPPLSEEDLKPLVDQAIADYSCADLLLRLPGMIPIPAFDTDIPLPATDWVDRETSSFTPEILKLLGRPADSVPCNTPRTDLSVSSHPGLPNRNARRRVVDTPLIVRPTSASAYTLAGRHALLQSMHVPEELQGEDTKIALISFGGQSIPRPRSRPPSPSPTSEPTFADQSPASSPIEAPSGLYPDFSHTSPTSPTSPTATQPPSVDRQASLAIPRRSAPGLLPPGWIAIVCGLSGDSNKIRADLPANFFASDKDVYVPDLTAVADVVVGKLGYGTCSETLATQTPLLYVPRKLFVEEFGLKNLMQTRGTALEFSRTDFEAGRWEHYILDAWRVGGAAKLAFREERRKGVVRDQDGAAFIGEELDKFLEGWVA